MYAKKEIDIEFLAPGDDNWVYDGKRYADSNGDPSFKIKVKNKGKVVLSDKYNRGKINNLSPVYAFIIHYRRNPGTPDQLEWTDVLVDPGVRNEY